MGRILELSRDGQLMSRIIIGGWEHDLHPLLPWGHRVIVITDRSISTRYRRLINQYEHIIIGKGEKIKTLATVEQLHRELIERGANRQTFLLGIGGGIVTDITGFVASTFMRGVRFGFVSTTLLGQVDASVGGKNGVNLDGYKNMIGCFNQPEFVLCDIGMLRTLSDRQFRAGLAELIKTGLLGNRVLFEMVEALPFEELRRDTLLMADLILMAVKIKAGIVERDERESGERRKLNLGHTLAHAIEKCSRKMLHGEAVAVGCVVMARLSAGMGLMPESEAARIEAAFARMGFDLKAPAPIDKMVAALHKDKKSAGDQIHIVLPTTIGRCEVRSVMFDWLDERLREVVK
ncbi:MAG: 3-dehydroquinate synthase [Rikenellaceae bacterium]|nr:3-dehydroquinate synthase [Rikenellaceae bacterium]